MLIGSESLMNVLREQVAMAEGCPRGAVIWIMRDQLSVVLDGLLVVATSCTELSHFAKRGDRRDVPFLILGLLLLLLRDLEHI